MTGWNLPPGVTDKMIDDHMSGGLCDPCIDGDHHLCTDPDCACTECEENARDDAAEARYEEWKEMQAEMRAEERNLRGH